MIEIKYKLIKRSRSPYWLVRLPEPCADGWQEKSTKETRRREAERAAARLIASIGKTEAKRTRWSTFREIYEIDHLSTLKKPGCFKSAANKLKELINPRYVDELNAATMKKFRYKMQKANMREATIASYLKHIRAALGWAEECGYIQQAPRVRTGSTAVMKGSPINLEQFERLLAATPKVTTKERAAGWKRLLEGLWLTGLRLQEALDLDWTDRNCIRPINLEGSHPLLSFPAHMQKNGKDQLVPLTPEAVKFLRKTPNIKREGKVFEVHGPGGPIRSSDRASRVISSIGQKSNIVTKTDPESGKKYHPTAHDLRRSFATRMAKRVPEDLLRELMRHADAKTTRAHYAEIDAESLAEQLSRALEE